MQPNKTNIPAMPTMRCRRIDRADPEMGDPVVLVEDVCIAPSRSGIIALFTCHEGRLLAAGGGTRCCFLRASYRPRSQHLGQDLILGPKAETRPSDSMRTLFTTANALGRWAITTTIPPRALTARRAFVRAASPAASKLELGSSRTTRRDLQKAHEQARCAAVGQQTEPHHLPQQESSSHLGVRE
jgi:hypothetical protein